LPRDLLAREPFVGVPTLRADGVPALDGLLIDGRIDALAAAPLVIRRGLGLQLLRLGRVEQHRHEGVAPAVLVHARGAVANPLPRHEHRHAAVEFELDHLARGRVEMASEVAEQPPREARASGAVAVGDPSGALDARVRAHVVHERDEPMIEDGEVEAEDLLGPRGDRATRLGHGQPRTTAVAKYASLAAVTWNRGVNLGLALALGLQCGACSGTQGERR